MSNSRSNLTDRRQFSILLILYESYYMTHIHMAIFILSWMPLSWVPFLMYGQQDSFCQWLGRLVTVLFWNSLKPELDSLVPFILMPKFTFWMILLLLSIQRYLKNFENFKKSQNSANPTDAFITSLTFVASWFLTPLALIWPHLTRILNLELLRISLSFWNFVKNLFMPIKIISIILKFCLSLAFFI